mgnify:CR=1 FL=1
MVRLWTTNRPFWFQTTTLVPLKWQATYSLKWKQVKWSRSTLNPWVKQDKLRNKPNKGFQISLWITHPRREILKVNWEILLIIRETQTNWSVIHQKINLKLKMRLNWAKLKLTNQWFQILLKPLISELDK